MILRYSATHKVEHTKVHRLDALDAYNQKLVKKIPVRGITVKGLAGSTAYLYLDESRVQMDKAVDHIGGASGRPSSRFRRSWPSG